MMTLSRMNDLIIDYLHRHNDNILNKNFDYNMGLDYVYIHDYLDRLVTKVSYTHDGGFKVVECIQIFQNFMEIIKVDSKMVSDIRLKHKKEKEKYLKDLEYVNKS